MSAFHKGELRMQALAGELDIASRVAKQVVHTEVPDVAATFLAQQRLLFVGHRDADGAVWASVLSGSPGFVSTPDSRTVRAAALPVIGDPLATSLADGPLPLGMLAIELGTRRRMRIDGVGEISAGAVQIRTEHVYSNCPKYISTRLPVEGPGHIQRCEPVRYVDGIEDEHRALIRSADTFFVASSHPDAGADISHRGGNPGFVTVSDDGHLSWPDYRGNSMYNTLGNIDVNPHAGLLFPNWETGGVLMMTGAAATDWSVKRAADVPGALRIVDFVVNRVVEVPDALGGPWRLEKLARTNPA